MDEKNLTRNCYVDVNPAARSPTRPLVVRALELQSNPLIWHSGYNKI